MKERTTVFLQAAHGYASKGIPVFPLEPRDKKPFGRLVPRGVLEASVDPARIDDWWKHGVSTCNIGIATGEPSGFFVVDVDPRHGGSESLDQLEREVGPLRSTRTARTGSGGLHLLFRMPPDEDVRNSAGLLGEGLDVRGTGGYIVAPPSIHPSGEAYQWISKDPVQDAPAKLLAKLTEKKPTAGTLSSSDATIPHGQQHETLVSLAGTMRHRGMTPDEIFPSLWQVNISRCERPGPEENIRQIANTVGAYEVKEEENAFNFLQRAISNGAGHLLHELNGHGVITSRSLHDRDVMTSVMNLWGFEKPLPREWVIDNFIPKGYVTMLAADGDTGKSFLCLYLSICVILGRPFFGVPVQQGPVLFVDFELDFEEQTRRLWAVLRGLDMMPDDDRLSGMFYYYSGRGKNLTSKAVQEEVISLIHEKGIALSILDSLTIASIGVDQASQADVTPMLQAFHAWGTVLCVDHLSRGSARGNLANASAFGSVFKRNLARSTFTLGKAPGGALMLVSDKNNFGPKRDLLGYMMDFREDMVSFRAVGHDAEEMTGAVQNMPPYDVTLMAVTDLSRSSRAGASMTEGVTVDDVVSWRKEHEVELARGTVQNHFTVLKMRKKIKYEDGLAVPLNVTAEDSDDTNSCIITSRVTRDRDVMTDDSPSNNGTGFNLDDAPF